MTDDSPINFLPLTPIRFLNRSARLYSKKEAIICGEERLTYNDFNLEQARLANALRDHGTKKGDVVAYLEYNCHRLLTAYYGVLQTGAILLPLNLRLSSAELAWIINDSGAKILFVDKELAHLIADHLGELKSLHHRVLMGDSVACPIPGLEYRDFLSDVNEFNASAPSINEFDIGELFYTSGTTGTPKGVMMSHRELYLHALYVIGSWGISSTDRVLHTIPLFHVNGWGTPQFLTAMGGTHVMLKRFEPQKVMKLLEAEKVTKMFLVPSMAQMLLDLEESHDYDLHLDYILIGGAPTSKELIRDVERRFHCRCVVGYGMTETTPVLTSMTVPIAGPFLSSLSSEEILENQAKTGVPILGVDLRVINDEGRDVRQDGREIGMIVVKSDVVMAGYWHREKETDKMLDKLGYFRTGDMAVVDENGIITIVDREKDLIISGGENIASVEVEKVILSNAAIKECAVIGIPDSKWGEVPCAIAVLKQEAIMSSEDLLGYCRQNLAHFKCPKSVEFVVALPHTSVGKIDKKQLREKYWKGRDKHVH